MRGNKITKKEWGSIHPCTHPCIHSLIRLADSLTICPSVCPSIHPSIHPCIHISIILSLHPYILHQPINPPLYLSIHLCRRNVFWIANVRMLADLYTHRNQKLIFFCIYLQICSIRRFPHSTDYINCCYRNCKFILTCEEKCLRKNLYVNAEALPVKVCAYLSIYLSINVSISISISISIDLSSYLSISSLSIHIYLPVCLHLYLSTGRHIRNESIQSAWPKGHEIRPH